LKYILVKKLGFKKISPIWEKLDKYIEVIKEIPIGNLVYIDESVIELSIYRIEYRVKLERVENIMRGLILLPL